MPQKSLTIINRIAVSVFFVVILDIFFLGGGIKALLPPTLTQFAWYYFIFGLPHIIASYVGYCNKEYLSFYRKEITKWLRYNLLILTFFIIFLPNLLLYFFIAYTMYHVTWQQIGICRRYIEHKTLYLLWSLSGIVSAVVLGLSVGGEAIVVVPHVFFVTLQTIGIFSLFIFGVAGVYLLNKGEYVVTTTLIIMLSSLAIVMGYYIVGIVMIRFTHDISAFFIYSKHDTQYQRKDGLNYIYNLFKVTPAWIFLFLPIFSVTVSFLLQMHKSFVFTMLIFLLSLMHYSLEGIVWRRGTLHRNTLS